MKQQHIALVTLIWCVGITIGFSAVHRYETTPGTVKDSPNQWPAQTQIPRDAEHYQLLVFVHPHCPCTRASLRELEVIIAQSLQKIRATVLFNSPAAFESEWAKTDLWNKASNIPHVTLYLDQNGAEAARFGAATSGHAMLYDREGRLVFSGGITSARGHEGWNHGRSSIIAAALEDTSQQEIYSCTPVFGCSLFNEPN